MRNVAVFFLTLALVGCNGPSGGDVYETVKKDMARRKSSLQLLKELFIGEFSCPESIDVWEELSATASTDAESEIIVSLCTLEHMKSVDSVDITKCIEKPNGQYNCLYSVHLTLRNYGETSRKFEGLFEESVSGWTLIEEED